MDTRQGPGCPGRGRPVTAGPGAGCDPPTPKSARAEDPASVSHVFAEDVVQKSSQHPPLTAVPPNRHRGGVPTPRHPPPKPPSASSTAAPARTHTHRHPTAPPAASPVPPLAKLVGGRDTPTHPPAGGGRAKPSPPNSGGDPSAPASAVQRGKRWLLPHFLPFLCNRSPHRLSAPVMPTRGGRTAGWCWGGVRGGPTLLRPHR